MIAEKYINDYDSVLLDAGSTAEMVADELFSFRCFLSVLTNNLGAYASYVRARLLQSATVESSSAGNELLLTGGRYDDTYESLLGKDTVASIREFRPMVTIIGVSGIKCEDGVFCHGADESSVKEVIWNKPTDRRIVAADWKKIGRVDAHAFGRIEHMNFDAGQAIIVTCNPPENTPTDEVQRFELEVREIEKRNVLVERVDVPTARKEKL